MKEFFSKEFKIVLLMNQENRENASKKIESLDFIEEYKDYLDWNILSRRSDLICEDFIEKFKDYIIWDNLYLTEEIFVKYFENFSKKRTIEILCGLKGEELLNYLEKLKDKIDWELFSGEIEFRNSNIEIFKRFKDKLDWEKLIYGNIFFTSQYIIEEFKDYINWDKFSRALGHDVYDLGIDRFKDKIEIFKEKINFNYIVACNRDINNILDFIEEYINYINIQSALSIWDQITLLRTGKIKDLTKFNWKEISNFFFRRNVKDNDFIKDYRDWLDWDILCKIYCGYSSDSKKIKKLGFLVYVPKEFIEKYEIRMNIVDKIKRSWKKQ